MKDLARVLPCAFRVTRGKSTLHHLYYDARLLKARRLVIVSVWKGNPGRISVYEPLQYPGEEFRRLIDIRLSGVALSRERGLTGRTGVVEELGVSITSQGLAGIADSIVRGFLARLSLAPRTTSQMVVVVRECERKEHCVAELDFVCADTLKPCGPLLRVAGVVDYVSGYRLHRRRGV